MTTNGQASQRQACLAGLSVTYTRAQSHWQAFKPLIESLGGHAIHMPLLTIRKRLIDDTTQQAIKNADYLVFTSVNAVEQFVAQALTVSSKQKLVSIGHKTTRALAQLLLNSQDSVKHTTNQAYSLDHIAPTQIITAPPPYDSEALLQVFAPHAKHIVIIAAPHGRQYLFQQLSAHNHVQFAYVYQRECQPIAPHLVEQSLQTQIMVMASCSSLDCLMENYPHQALKLIQYRACIAGISVKVADYARHLGFQHTIHAQQASEQALIDAMAHWWSNNKELEL